MRSYTVCFEDGNIEILEKFKLVYEVNGERVILESDEIEEIIVSDDNDFE